MADAKLLLVSIATIMLLLIATGDVFAQLSDPLDSCDSPASGPAPKENDACLAKSRTYDGPDVKGRCVYRPSNFVVFFNATQSGNCKKSPDSKSFLCLYCSYAGTDSEIRPALSLAKKELEQGQFDAVKKRLMPLYSRNVDLESERVYLLSEALYRQKKYTQANFTLMHAHTFVDKEHRFTPIYIKKALLDIRIRLRGNFENPRDGLIRTMTKMFDFKASQDMWDELEKGALALPLEEVLSQKDRKIWADRIALGKKWAKAGYPGTRVCYNDPFVLFVNDKFESNIPLCIVKPDWSCIVGFSIYLTNSKKVAKLKPCEKYWDL